MQTNYQFDHLLQFLHLLHFTATIQLQFRLLLFFGAKSVAIVAEKSGGDRYLEDGSYDHKYHG